MAIDYSQIAKKLNVNLVEAKSLGEIYKKIKLFNIEAKVSEMKRGEYIVNFSKKFIKSKEIREDFTKAIKKINSFDVSSKIYSTLEKEELIKLFNKTEPKKEYTIKLLYFLETLDIYNFNVDLTDLRYKKH
jgi:hypothetical protein